ncbi:unannotated protein [freshwater metagenome]|uniref:Unannotated protein n=1 Tax=freshwater metagenome TaxID=449393 RepID=A0A6J6X2U0_9ZZZZ
MRNRGLAKEERRVHVDCSHAPVLLFGHFGEVVPASDSGHVDEYIETTEHLNGFSDSGETLSTFGDVSDSRHGSPAGGGDHRNSFRERLGVHVVDEDLSTLCGESQ